MTDVRSVAVDQEPAGGRRGRGAVRGGAAARRAARSGGGPGPSAHLHQAQDPLYEVLNEEG
jgi:trimethylamine--corrinoid protein Co-methyltransferase